MKKALILLILLLCGNCMAFTDHECEVPLERWNKVVVGRWIIDVLVHNENILTFRASTVKYGRLIKYEKVDGFDRDKSNLTEFYRTDNSVLYFVNTPRSAPGNCILLIRDF